MTEKRSRPADELTTRTRIRDAAMQEFAEHGVGGATIRGIARAAGVSPGLVQHHFGSKDGLRRACDEHAMETIRQTKVEGLQGGIGSPAFATAALDTALPLQRYLARSLRDGTSAAADLFDDAVELTESMLQGDTPGLSRPDTSDLHAYSAVLTGISFGLMALHEHLSRALGSDTLTEEGYPRMARAMVDILADGLLSPEIVEQMRTTMDQMIAEGPRTEPGPRISTSAAAARKTDSDPPDEPLPPGTTA